MATQRPFGRHTWLIAKVSDFQVEFNNRIQNEPRGIESVAPDIQAGHLGCRKNSVKVRVNTFRFFFLSGEKISGLRGPSPTKIYLRAFCINMPFVGTQL